MRLLKVFGFGSFFRRGTESADIDLILLHKDATYASAMFAIRCKAVICRIIPCADIVMLSEEEACGTRFLSRSRATYICILTDDSVERQVRMLSRYLSDWNELNGTIRQQSGSVDAH